MQCKSLSLSIAWCNHLVGACERIIDEHLQLVAVAVKVLPDYTENAYEIKHFRCLNEWMTVRDYRLDFSLCSGDLPKNNKPAKTHNWLLGMF
jgi:hypothetical protein